MWIERALPPNYDEEWFDCLKWHFGLCHWPVQVFNGAWKKLSYLFFVFIFSPQVLTFPFTGVWNQSAVSFVICSDSVWDNCYLNRAVDVCWKMLGEAPRKRKEQITLPWIVYCSIMGDKENRPRQKSVPRGKWPFKMSQSRCSSIRKRIL